MWLYDVVTQIQNTNPARLKELDSPPDDFKLGDEVLGPLGPEFLKLRVLILAKSLEGSRMLEDLDNLAGVADKKKKLTIMSHETAALDRIFWTSLMYSFAESYPKIWIQDFAIRHGYNAVCIHEEVNNLTIVELGIQPRQQTWLETTLRRIRTMLEIEILPPTTELTPDDHVIGELPIELRSGYSLMAGMMEAAIALDSAKANMVRDDFNLQMAEIFWQTEAIRLSFWFSLRLAMGETVPDIWYKPLRIRKDWQVAYHEPRKILIIKP